MMYRIFAVLVVNWAFASVILGASGMAVFRK